jgi:hypothetical protein
MFASSSRIMRRSSSSIDMGQMVEPGRPAPSDLSIPGRQAVTRLAVAYEAALTAPLLAA